MPYSDPEKQRLWQRDWKRRKRNWLWEYKKTLCCRNCGFNHPAALQFHHLGDKDNTISNMIDRNVSEEKIMLEIKKCEVLCANCHAIEHNEQHIPAGDQGSRMVHIHPKAGALPAPATKEIPRNQNEAGNGES